MFILSPARVIIHLAMLHTERRPLTVADYMSLPEDGPRYQLIDGELFLAPSPNRNHQFISGELEFALRSYLKKNPIGVIYDAPFDVELSETTVVQPDIAYFSKERLSRLTEQGAKGGPDLVVEILSPSTAQLDLGRKREIYAQSGVREMWIVYPRTRRVMIYRLQEDQENPVETLEANRTLQTPLLPGFSVPLSEIFGA
ncbi:MAG TPA: Uma2 family endonuclease [Chthoniobacterales bacterium]|nr:Uma2 family endonuclease [Chthoniobacterales bacterium]